MRADMKRAALTAIGAVLCIAPPAVTTLIYFPAWVEKSSTSTISGLSLFLLLLSIIPLFKMLKGFFATPSAPVLWAVVLVFAALFRSIIDQICVIAFVGVVSSLVGMVVFKQRDKYNDGE